MAGNKVKTSVGMIILWFLSIILAIASFTLQNDSSFQKQIHTFMTNNQKTYISITLVGILILSLIATGITTFRITSRRWVFPKALVITILTVYLMVFSFAFVKGSQSQVLLVKDAGYLLAILLAFYFIYLSIVEYKKK
ncbi:MAG: hypothetical protein IEMM0008_0736 [bacterium]|nr:MAG: hypothetical protein IEMM0008_0736 [bacterium]